MYKPVLSIDVSKSKSYAAAFLNHGEPFLKPFTFNHSPKDAKSLINHLKNLEDKAGVKPEVVLEATGNYSKPIYDFFEQSGYNVIVLNPLQTHQQKAKSIRKIKTDPVDANRIAQVYYLNNCRPSSPLEDQLEDLRNLCRQYEGLNTLYTETCLHVQNILDLLFPGYDTVFKNTYCKSSLAILSAYPSPSDIISADKDHLVDIIKSVAKGHSVEWCKRKADKLINTARESLPNRKAQQSNIRVLKDYIRILMTHQEVLAGIRAQIIEQASLSPAYFLLRSIPGVGELTAAIILSEIGDVNRFPSVKQLVAFSGLDPSVFESGKFKSTNNRISKRGSSYLRKALYQATFIGIGKRKDKLVNPVLYEFYSKKIAEGKATKVALIACCNKLLRIIYGVWHSEKPFINVQ